MMVRIDQTRNRETSPGARLNLLLSYGAGQEGSVIEQLPRLLSPMGIHSIRVTTGEGAAKVICVYPIHIAVVDLTIPLVGDAPARPGGARLLQLLRRLEEPPPPKAGEILGEGPEAVPELVRRLQQEAKVL